MSIGINNFVKRQNAESKYSYFIGSWEELVKLVEDNFTSAKQGYKDGVMLVPVDPKGFLSGVAELTEDTQIRASFSARRRGEDPYIQFEALNAEKLPALVVEIVVYRKDVLGSDASTDFEWEIISINARPTFEEEPINPVTMARNFLELNGGTKADYTAKEFAEAIIYWSKRAMIAV